MGANILFLNSMEILIISLYAINTPHFETELEIAQKHIDNGDSVRFLHCNSSLYACDVNPQHNIFTCFQCINKRKKGFRLLPELIDKQLLTNLNNKDYNNLKKFEFSHKTINDLKKHYIDNFDIGYGVLSSLVSYTRDSEPLIVKHKQLITNLFKSSLLVYWSVTNHLLSKKTDRVYVFNGRFAPCRAAFRAAQSCKVDCYI